METAHHPDAPGNSWKKLQSLLSVVPTLLWHTYPLLIKHGNGRSCIQRFFSHIKTIKHPLIRDFPLLRIWLAEATPSSAVFFRVENSRSPEGRESDVRSEWCCGLPSQIEHHSSKGGAWTSVENGSQTPSYGHSIRKVMMNQQDLKEISEIPFGTLHFQTNSNVGLPVFRHFPFRFFSNIQLSIGLKDLETLFAAAAHISWGHHTFCSTTRALVSSQTSVLPCLGRFVSLGTSESNGFLEKSRKTVDQCFLALLETKEHDGTCFFFFSTLGRFGSDFFSAGRFQNWQLRWIFLRLPASGLPFRAIQTLPRRSRRESTMGWWMFSELEQLVLSERDL